ncbi:response regulator [Chitinophaga sp. CF118]|uniref:ATP-binding response regulator n=1 Tax=Chitinophaga sp. CF118 TaxID=1884367 RepID=UPI0015A62D97|nr:response regulator [Chitinophaga sp. CF118]
MSLYAGITVGVVAVVCLLLLIKIRNLKVQLQRKNAIIAEHAETRIDILNNINQEIRTPLNAVIGFSEQLGHSSMEKDQRELLKTIERAAGMLVRVVNNVQDLSRIEKKELQLEQQPFSLYQAFSEIIVMMRAQASRKQLQFDAFYEGNRQLLVTGDLMRLKQILINLADNAIRYTDSGAVTIKTIVHKLEEGKAEVKIIVTDTGRGITADALPLIFEHFLRRRIPYTAAVNGAGLGLAITKGLLQLHNGSINVNSIPGTGSTFSCNILYNIALAPQTLLITQREVEQMTGHFMEGRYVLVADDQEMNLVLIEKILTRWKCRFDKAPDGKEAYDLFCANNYDMVLLDLQMPRMSGIEVVKKIRTDKDTIKANIPVLALTADTTLQDNDAFLEVGFDGYLLKPFRERDIYNVIIQHLPYNPSQEIERIKS